MILKLNFKCDNCGRQVTNRSDDKPLIAKDDPPRIEHPGSVSLVCPHCGAIKQL